jgi:hypothetical protein
VTKLYEIALPILSNDGSRPYVAARACWELRALEIAGGYTRRAVGRGFWKHEGKIYVDDMIPYRVACSPAQLQLLVAEAFRLFPDQVAICTTEMGEQNIVLREAATATHKNGCLGTPANGGHNEA